MSDECRRFMAHHSWHTVNPVWRSKRLRKYPSRNEERMMDPVQPPPKLPRPPSYPEPAPWQTTVLVMALSMPFPLLCFVMWLLPGGINISMNASTAALRISLFILPVPLLVLAAFSLQYLWRRCHKRVKTPSPNAVMASLGVVLFWVCALGWQSHRDAVFQRNLEARLQPWAESILARPRAEVLDRNYIREDLVPAFVGRRGIWFQSAKDSTYGANEDSIAIFYGVHQSVGGYVVGRKTLRIEEGARGARKIKDGLYRFQDEN